MTELDTINNGAGDLAALDPTALGAGSAVDLAAWLERAADAERLARMLVRSAFVPDSFKPSSINSNNPEQYRMALEVASANATGAILLGQSLGLDPLTALQNIFVIKGKPSMYAKTKVAILKRLGHNIWEQSRSAESVTVCGAHRGSPGEVVTVTVTIQEAERAGWLKNDTYKTTPADMLYARAASRVCDRIDPGALLGIPSTDAMDDGPTRVEGQAAAPGASGRALVDQLAPPAPVTVTRATGAGGATQRLDRIRARLTELHVPQEDWPTVVAHLVRPVGSLAELTEREAVDLLGDLSELNAVPMLTALLGWSLDTGEIAAAEVVE
jgi:hypothetical protein